MEAMSPGRGKKGIPTEGLGESFWGGNHLEHPGRARGGEREVIEPVVTSGKREGEEKPNAGDQFRDTGSRAKKPRLHGT